MVRLRFSHRRRAGTLVWMQERKQGMAENGRLVIISRMMSGLKPSGHVQEGRTPSKSASVAIMQSRGRGAGGEGNGGGDEHENPRREAPGRLQMVISQKGKRKKHALDNCGI